MKLLNEKKAIITGGSRGIGEAMVRQLAAAGADIVFTYRSSTERADALAKAVMAETGQQVYAIQSDATDFSQAEALVKEASEKMGRIDILINNAGITRDNLMLRMTETHWDEVINTNLKSVFNLTKHALRPMLKQRNGSIINITSIVGLEGNAGQSNYAASKAGIIGFTKSIAKEVASRNIRCNAVAPGFIQTEMTDALDDKTVETFLQKIPMKRLGTPDNVAHLCSFLASDMASYINGQVISVCGGIHS